MQKMHNVMLKSEFQVLQTEKLVDSFDRRHWLAAGLGICFLSAARAKSTADKPPLRVAAASDLRAALPQVVKDFTAKTGLDVQVSYGSSGNFARQIQQGLPVDVFMSADHTWVELLQKAGLARGQAKTYALGRLAWFSATLGAHVQADLQRSVAQVMSMKGKLAIANPEHAPYGRAAVQVLKKWGVWDAVQSNLVLGDNVAQAMQFASTGAALAAITALPLVSGPGSKLMGSVIPIEAQAHEPLQQQMMLTQKAVVDGELWIQHMQTPEVKKHLQAFGFDMALKG